MTTQFYVLLAVLVVGGLIRMAQERRKKRAELEHEHEQDGTSA